MSGFDLLLCEMPLPDDTFGPGTLFCTRAFDGVLSDVYWIAADGHRFGPFEESSLSATEPNQLARGDTGAGYRAESRPLAFNGDIEFWTLQPPRRIFFACLVDGRCVRILTEDEYCALMEKARRWALFSSFSN
jgi:hypothetical protein